MRLKYSAGICRVIQKKAGLKIFQYLPRFNQLLRKEFSGSSFRLVVKIEGYRTVQGMCEF